MSRDVMPFLVPSEQSWHVGGWYLLRDDDWQPLPDLIDDWDTDTDLHLRMIIEVDRAAVTEQTQITYEAPLVVTASWFSSSNQMTELIGRVAVDGRAISLQAIIPAARIGGVLSIVTTLALAGPALGTSVASPREAGSVLLRADQSVALQGDGAMFPVAVVDFAATPFDVDSSWMLEVSSELEAPFLGVFQLLINSRDTELVRAVTRPGGDAGLRQLVFDLEEGVASVMAECALAAGPELRSAAEWEAGTVGAVLSTMLEGVTSRGLSAAGPGLEAVSDFRSRLSGVVRSLGYGRVFT